MHPSVSSPSDINTSRTVPWRKENERERELTVGVPVYAIDENRYCGYGTCELAVDLPFSPPAVLGVGSKNRRMSLPNPMEGNRKERGRRGEEDDYLCEAVDVVEGLLWLRTRWPAAGKDLVAGRRQDLRGGEKRKNARTERRRSRRTAWLRRPNRAPRVRRFFLWRSGLILRRDCGTPYLSEKTKHVPIALRHA